MAKNIVIFSDGTGQEGGKKNNTNVYKLFNMIEDRSSRQIAFYDRGLGTGFRKLTGSAAGRGISKNIRECYEFLFENYQSRDQVYLFGFSRGAYTVRSLSGFIEMFGILPRSRPELIKKAYRIYKMKEPKRARKRDEFLAKHHTMRCPIKLIGVWDTVGALGLPIKALEILNPFKRKFHNTEMCMNVEAGRHALSIDDERKTFWPAFWDERELGTTPDGVEQDVKQVWFIGMHTDVGGGYKEQQLSDIALDWMFDEAKSFGLLPYANHKVRTSASALGKMHDSREKLGHLYRKAVRQLDDQIQEVLVHSTVQERANAPEAQYAPWILSDSHSSVP